MVEEIEVDVSPHARPVAFIPIVRWATMNSPRYKLLAMTPRTPSAGDARKYGQLASGVAAQQKREAEKEKNRRFGLVVQCAIEGYLDKRELHPRFVDQGYDCDLFLDDQPAIDAGTHHFELADYLIEVKATTSGEVRLTPAQARMASEEPDRFILCVVDLRGVAPERLEGDWTPEDVGPRARIVAQIGLLARKAHGLVEQAKGCEVGIRNDGTLRYGVPVPVWELGSSLAEWVDSLPLSPSVVSGGVQ